jgi:archaeal type IV pilus assembly protein PilA
MDNSENWFDRGVSLSEEGNYNDAITAFNKAITCNQSVVDAWCNRGLVYAQLGKYQLALQSFDQTLALDPGHENAKKARTMVLGLMEKTKNSVSSPVVPHPSAVAAPPGQRESPGPVPAPRPPVPSRAKESIRNPVYAVIFSFLFPGWGQWYNGERWKGLAFFVLSIISGILRLVMSILLNDNLLVSVVFLLIGVAIWIYGMYDAYITAEGMNRGEIGFTRKSRLFWFPIVFVVLMIILTLILAAVIAAFVFGMAGNIQHTRVVAATVQQVSPGDIVVTYQGGQDADKVTLVTVEVTDSEGSSRTEILSPPEDTGYLDPGSEITFTGRFAGRDHVVGTASFTDGTDQVILDTYV